jgi:hypothetical protein
MRAFYLFLFTALTLTSSISQAHSPSSSVQVAPEAVDEFHFFGRLDSWRAVDRNTLIVWTTPFKPYLIELKRPASGLRFAEVIGLTSTAGTVYTRFDTVRVDGFRYPIRSIYRLTKEQARNWGRQPVETT